MSLYGKNPRYTWGVLRNAQLIPVYLPDWTLRVYVADDLAPDRLAVSARMINKMRLLGAEIVHVSTKNSMAPRNWRLLVTEDHNVDYFLVRDADIRLSDREANAVRYWLSVAKKNKYAATIYCIRDHPEHAEQAIVDGLWGGRQRRLYQMLKHNLTQMVNSITYNSTDQLKMRTFLNHVLWPAVINYSLCHDSVSPCDRWSPTASRHLFRLPPRQGKEYIGQKFDAHQELISKTGDFAKSGVASC